jgi:hypothetical protein
MGLGGTEGGLGCLPVQDGAEDTGLTNVLPVGVLTVTPADGSGGLGRLEGGLEALLP